MLSLNAERRCFSKNNVSLSYPKFHYLARASLSIRAAQAGLPEFGNDIPFHHCMLKDRVEQVIDQKVRPALQRDGGNIELVDVNDEGVVKVRLRGACSGCPGAMMTLQFGVQRILQQEIQEVTKVVPVA